MGNKVPLLDIVKTDLRQQCNNDIHYAAWRTPLECQPTSKRTPSQSCSFYFKIQVIIHLFLQQKFCHYEQKYFKIFLIIIMFYFNKSSCTTVYCHDGLDMQENKKCIKYFTEKISWQCATGKTNKAMRGQY